MIALCVVLIAAAIGIFVRFTGSEPEGEETVATGGAAQSPEEAVQAYLDAIAAGDSQAALDQLYEEPADTTFLTDEMLQASAELAPITNIQLGSIPESEFEAIPFSFDLGGRTVMSELRTTEYDGSFYVSDGVTPVTKDQFIRGTSVPLLVNGVELTGEANFFVGTYSVSTGLANIDFPADQNTFSVEEFGYGIYGVDLDVDLTDAGLEAFQTAAKTALDNCVAQKKLDPEGCPLAIQESSGQSVDESTIKWTVQGDPIASLDPQVDVQDPSIVEDGFWDVKIDFTASGTIDGQSATFEGFRDTWYLEASADMTADSVVVTLS